MKSVVFLTMLSGVAAVHSGLAAENKYHITPEEQAACQDDATVLCSYAYPDEDKLLECMRKNRSQLSEVCLRAFDAGLRRRHLT